MFTRRGAALAASALLLAGCGEDEPAQGLEAFCESFASPAAGGGLSTRAEVTQAAAFFEQLERTAPEEIAPQVSTVADGLASLVEAFDDAEPGDGLDAVEGVQEAAGVDLGEVSRAADEVEQFAVENCENVEPTE